METRLYENCYKSSNFFNLVRGELDGFKKFQGFSAKELLLYNRMEAFIENFHQKWENASYGAQFRYFQIK